MNDNSKNKFRKKLRRSYRPVKDEEKVLKYALRISELEYTCSKKNTGKSFDQIKPSQTFNATEIDFLEPLKYIDSLWNEDSNTGVLKIIPPKQWVAYQQGAHLNRIVSHYYGEESNSLPARSQKLSKLYEAKKFENNSKLNTKQYIQHGEKLKERLFGPKSSPSEEEIEKKYWELVKPDNEENVEVLYAADLEISKILSRLELRKYMQSFSLPVNFTLANMNYLPDSLLQFTSKENEENLMSGINIPWFYYGNLFSTFCWHVEDLFCYSINYLHSGSPKIWYSIPTNQKHKFEKYVKNKYYAIILKDPNLLHRLTVHISPLELIENNIEVYRTIQRPGDIVVTMPCGYHSGFSTGFNLGEAVNFTTAKWLKYGLNSIEHYKRDSGKKPIFSIEWLLFKLDRYKKDIIISDQSLLECNQALDGIICKEYARRIELEESLKLKFVKFIVEDFNAKTDFYCGKCPNISYLSQIHCNKCRMKTCILHTTKCKCEVPDLRLFYRKMER